MVRNTTAFRVVVAIVAGLVVAPGDHAANAQAPTVLTTFEDEMITMVDIADGSAVILPNTREFANRGENRVNYRLKPAHNGYDMHVTFTNDSPTAAPLGNLTVAGLRLGQIVNYVDVRYDSKITTLDHQNANFFGPGRDYPRSLYSPVLVLGDENYWVGISLHYPIVEYDHSVQLAARSPGGSRLQHGRNWEVDIKLIDQLPPGEAREYVVAVRVIRADQPWIQTLVPYRDYFHELYGPVQYQRDPRPVMSYNMAGNSFVSTSNPYGFSATGIRPDLVGYAPHVERLDDYHNVDDHVRIMVWAPSGVFLNNTGQNYPFLFMSNMVEVPMMSQTRLLLADVPAPPDLEIGYWWGRSSQVMTAWDTSSWQGLDVDNPDHVQRALREIDLARELNCTMVGLDAFVYHPSVSDMFRSLAMLRAHAPEIRFVVEPSPPDILHFQAGGFTEARLVSSEKILADFLVPGHETWAKIRFDIIESQIGRPVTTLEKETEIARVANLGYVPVISAGNKRTQPWIAAESWRNSIPEELQLQAPRWNTNYDPSVATIDDNGRLTIVSDSTPTPPNESFVDPRTGRVRRGVVAGYVPSEPIVRRPTTTNVAGILSNTGPDPLPVRGRSVPLRMSPKRNTPITVVTTGEGDLPPEDPMHISLAGQVGPPEREDVIPLASKHNIAPQWYRTFIPSGGQLRDAIRRARARPHGEAVIQVAEADDD